MYIKIYIDDIDSFQRIIPVSRYDYENIIVELNIHSHIVRVSNFDWQLELYTYKRSI